MNKKFKHGDSVVQAKISRIIQLLTLTFFLLNNSLLAAPRLFQSTGDLTKASVSENPLQQPQRTITGKVTDQTGASIPGASVLVKGTTIGTTTDINGNYSLSNTQQCNNAHRYTCGNEITGYRHWK